MGIKFYNKEKLLHEETCDDITITNPILEYFNYSMIEGEEIIIASEFLQALAPTGEVTCYLDKYKKGVEKDTHLEQVFREVPYEDLTIMVKFSEVSGWYELKLDRLEEYHE